ncbi:rap guanine nucleotide exchange factor 2-like isoform X6, partial [Dinothrombium tinctorium]
YSNGQQNFSSQLINKTTDCLTLEASDILLLDYTCGNEESSDCPYDSSTTPTTTTPLPSNTSTPTTNASSNNGSNHQRASSMYSCHSDTTTATTNTTTSSDSEIDLTGLVEGLVDDETEERDKGEEDCYISLSHRIPSPSNQLVVLRQVLEKDPIERTEAETEIILNFINNIPAFSKYDVNIRKQLAAVMVLAIIEKPSTIILTHLEILDSFCCLIYGQVEHLYNNKTSRQLHPGDVFGITEPTMDTIYFEGIMKTCSPYCWFLCVSQTDFYKILNHSQSEFCRHEEDGKVVLITEHRNIDNYRKGHVIIRGTASKLLLGLLDCDSSDPFYIDDYLLTYRIFMPPSKNSSSLTNLLSGMDTICAKLLSWFDEQHLRDKVIRIVLTWINCYYLDFDNVNLPNPCNPVGQQFLQLFEAKLCSSLTLTTQLRLFHVALSTKAKVRHVTITRSNRDDEVLNFSILGGYEKGFGIFVSKVDEGSKAENVGLKRGDQILEVNGTNFAIISHARALEVLRSTTHLALTVRYNPFMFREMIALPEGSKNKKPIATALNTSAAITLNPTLQNKPNGGFSSSGTKIKKAIPKFANFITRRFNNLTEDQVDFHQPTARSLSASRSHSNPDLHTLTSTAPTSPFHELIAGHNHFSSNPQHVIRVFNAANGDSRYLLVHAETVAREVVMVSVREFGLCSQSSSGAKSSLNYSLYEVSVVPEANTIKQRRLPDQLSNLAERASLHSRYYIKENTSSTTSTTNTTQQQLSDDIATEILRECPQSLSFLNLNTLQIALELTLQDFNIFRSIEPQEFIYDLFSDELRKDEQELNLWRKELQEFESLSNKEMFWVINEILNEQSLVKRVKIIKYFIKIGNFCRTLHNYNSLFAILSGLGHGSVQRLKQTWDKLGAKYHKILKALQKIMDPSRNMALYRGEINTRSPPIIPFFPIVKKDLTFIHLAHLTYNCEDGLINFDKMRMLGKEIRNIINMSSQQYPCNTTSTQSGIPLPPPPPTTTFGPSATTPKRMFEEAMMRKKVKHYLSNVFSTIIYDEDALLAKSFELEAGAAPPQPVASAPSQTPPTTKPANKTQPSPTLSSTSSGSSSGKLKFGAESPQQLRKLLSLSEVDSKVSRNAHHHNHHPNNAKSLNIPMSSQQHIRSISEGQSQNNVMINTVSFQSQPHLHRHHHMHTSFPPRSVRHHSSVPLPIESSSVTSLRRLEQFQQIKKYQCNDAMAPFASTPNMRPPLPNYDEAIQRQHKLMNLVSATKQLARSQMPAPAIRQTSLTRNLSNDDDKVSAV